MNNKYILELLENTDSIMSESSRIKNVLRLNNNLFGFEVINRLLIELQYNKSEYAFELKSKQEWEIEGRQVIDEQEPIYITVPVYKTSYMDIDTGLEITEEDKLTHDELVKAIELGLVSRVEDMNSMSVMPVYDIRQTLSITPNYKVKHFELSSSRLLDLTSNLMGCSIQIGNDYKYSKENHVLIVRKDTYINIANALSSILAKYMINNKLKSILIGTKESSDCSISNEDLNFIYKGLTFSINTLFNGNIDIDLEIKENINANKFIYMLNLIYCLISDVVASVINNDTHSNVPCTDYITSISRIQKAEAILAIMEANDINKIINN